METCNLVYSARVTTIPVKIRVEGKVSGACIIRPSGHVFLAGFKRESEMQKCFKEALKTAKLRQRDVLSGLRLVNSTFKLSDPLVLTLGLDAIVQRCGTNARFNPLHFPGIVFNKVANTTCTGILYRNGQLLVTGARSEGEGKHVMQELVDSIIELQAPMSSRKNNKKENH